MAATAVSPAEACVSGAAGVAAASSMTSAMLGPYGYSQEKGERRDGHQAAHTS